MTGVAGKNCENGGMDKDEYPEKRRHRRRKVEAAAVILNGMKYQFEKTAEIGEGGMLLRVTKPLVKGDLVEIQMILPTRRFISAKGEVIYDIMADKGKVLIGIRFITLSDQSQRFIREYVESE